VRSFYRGKKKAGQQYIFVIPQSQYINHNGWVEQEVDRKFVAQHIIDVIREDANANALPKTENGLVEIMARLIEAAIWCLPVEYTCKVTRYVFNNVVSIFKYMTNIMTYRSEQQSIASKERNNLKETGSRDKKLDFMIQALFRRQWNKLLYVKSGKCGSNDTKILNDHNKLVRLCIDGYHAIQKKTSRKKLSEFFIEFAINLSGNVKHLIAFPNFTSYLIISSIFRRGFCDPWVSSTRWGKIFLSSCKFEDSFLQY